MERKVELGEKFTRDYGHFDWLRLTIGHSSAEVYQTDHFILKKQCKAAGSSLLEEKCKIEWLKGKLPVAEVIDYETDETYEYLLTSRLIGKDAAQSRWTTFDPTRLVRQLGLALRDLHDKVEITHCPFDMRLTHRFERASDQLKEQIADLIATAPSEDLVFTHGDYCLPNILIGEDECQIAGFVDLGGAGIADRYSDLALGLRSIQYNLGDGYAQIFLDAYGITSDQRKIDFYQKLDELL